MTHELDEKAWTAFVTELTKHIDYDDDAYKAAIRAYLSAAKSEPVAVKRAALFDPDGFMTSRSNGIGERAAPTATPAVKAWCQPMKEGKHTPRQFVVLYEDAEQGICTFDDEAEARDHWERANVNWNCYLLGTLPLASEPANG